ncbi:oxygen-independent coproporphyrinogen III oxidase [Aquimarina sp. U1-2]|uniref:oxygen-independent coproporphyrinogen III oxidase n=1 Tax=Aquimarina sp. U1-2 TaxID=2823141 RepID=UPI001AECC394|nr:oxygen-independent coproporphyrinogen III oxidase [Aquimarina sp. U1-2]MBP2831480.1 oxygen-independent coproporphyrinogen III oxidase [Aquimarina sp. U1-2]
MCTTLTDKYNVPGPRYTSYPTVPYWDNTSFSLKNWKFLVKNSFDQSNKTEGISLYIHLPFCESLCTFCGCHKRVTKQHDVERPYIDALLKEWQLYCTLLDSKPKIKELHLGGGTPTFFSPEHLLRLIEGIFHHAKRSDCCEFSFEGHPCNTTQAHLQALYNVGFRRVSFGVQDYDSTVQKAINRVQSYETVKKITETARAVGYTSVGHDIIFGLPFQTEDTVINTIRKTKDLLPDRIAFYSYAHVPWLKGNGQRGFEKSNLPTALQKRKQYETGKNLLTEAGYVAIGMDHFALKKDTLYRAMKAKKLHRNFMGYTASKTQMMIGLGASSISDSWYGFAQNVKGIEEYIHLINEGIIPVYRGHVLTKKDEIIRRHILNLMCHFETGWTTKKDYFCELPKVLDRLEGMQKDGLLIITDTLIKVTEKGRPFIRNICMAFDLRLHYKHPEKQVFSMTV